MGQVVTADVVKNLLPGLKTTFMQGFANVELPFKRIVTEVPSTLQSENYAWLGQAPTVREWTDERIPKGLSEFSYTIKNKKWENSIRVDREVLEDEQYGQVTMRVGQLPTQVAKHQNQLVFALLEAGDSTVCYDGANFFSASHSEGNSGTQVNVQTSSALTATTYQAARTKMAGFKDDQGQIVGTMGTLLVVPPALEGTGRGILNADFVTDGTAGGGGITNIWKGSAELLVVPWLTSTTAWYLIDLNEYINPIIFQNRVTTEFDHLTNDNGGETPFFRDAFFFGTRSRYNVGYGDWRTAVKSS